jgi:hypothetical protein
VIRTLRGVDPKRGPWPILEGAIEDVVHAGRDESIEARDALRPLTGETPAVALSRRCARRSPTYREVVERGRNVGAHRLARAICFPLPCRVDT